VDKPPKRGGQNKETPDNGIVADEMDELDKMPLDSDACSAFYSAASEFSNGNSADGENVL
jgi:hypothetical protein